MSENTRVSAFYDGTVPKNEVERLKNYDYPNTVSQLFLPKKLSGQTLLDIGAGSSSTMQEIVEQHEGTYMALDQSPDLLRARTRSGVQIQGDARHIPLEIKSDDDKVDLSHCRFVLMHLSPEDRALVISEMDRVSKNNIILDYDWGSWEKRITDDQDKFSNKPEYAKSINLQKRFLENSKALGEKGKIEMNMGSKLKTEAEQILKKEVTEKRVIREPGKYYNEMIMVGLKANTPMWRKLGDENRAQEIEQIVREIEQLSPEEQAPFCWTDIVGITWQ